jgi:DNA-binding winged helix-turn-helix (wHTH) protein/Tfp pilus assembly protein PilF
MAVYAFGPFRLDGGARRLTRGGERLPIADRHLDILLELVSHPGELLSKDALIQAAWRDVAVTDNSLEQAISTLRRRLGPGPDGEPLIQTVPRRGYRFAGDVSRPVHRESDERLDALLAPHRAWLEGRAALETLGRDEANAARDAFARALELAPDAAPVHVGMAHACAFRFESTRADLTPDAPALAAAVHHAREACRLDPQLPDAWATLGFVLHRAGAADDAMAAARRAISLEPGNWRHQLRLAVVAWGEERLRAAARTLQMMPGLAIAHFLAATVHVARQAFDLAERELEVGAGAQDEQPARPSRFAAVGLHWLRGLVRLRAGDSEAAAAAFERELAFEPVGHLYSRECCAQVHYAVGAVALGAGDRDAALHGFTRALAYAGGHPMALAGLTALAGGHDAGCARAGDLASRLAVLEAQGLVIDAAAAAGVANVIAADSAAAAIRLERAIASAAPGAQGWNLPLDPLLRMTGDRVWAPALALLRARAA